MSCTSHSDNKSFFTNIPTPPEPHFAVFNCDFLLTPYQVKPDIFIFSSSLNLVSKTNTISGLTYAKICSLISQLLTVHEFTFHDTILKRFEALLLDLPSKIYLSVFPVQYY